MFREGKVPSLTSSRLILNSLLHHDSIRNRLPDPGPIRNLLPDPSPIRNSLPDSGPIGGSLSDLGLVHTFCRIRHYQIRFSLLELDALSLATFCGTRVRI